MKTDRFNYFLDKVEEAVLKRKEAQERYNEWYDNRSHDKMPTSEEAQLECRLRTDIGKWEKRVIIMSGLLIDARKEIK